MNQIAPHARKWLSDVLDVPFKATKHMHSHQDEAYKIEAPNINYYLKVSSTLKAECDNLKKLEGLMNVPKVINFYESDEKDYLLISELPGKNLVELMDEWSKLEIVDTFAKAIKQLHSLDATKAFPEASAKDVLLHGDMALPNIIISKEQEIGYIDFGQMAFGPPELDLADAIWSLQRNLGPDYGELFLEKYGPVAMTPKIKKALEFRYQPSEGS
jgi:aminoglycoside phosphotransferase